MENRMLLTGLSIVFLINLMQAAAPQEQQYPKIRFAIKFTNRTGQRIALKYFDERQNKVIQNLIKPNLNKKIFFDAFAFGSNTIRIYAPQNKELGNLYLSWKVLQTSTDPEGEDVAWEIQGTARLTTSIYGRNVIKEDEVEYQQSTMPKEVGYSVNVTYGADSTIDLGASVD